MKVVECSFFITDCCYTFSNANGIEKLENFQTKISDFVQFNHRNYCCNVRLNMIIKQLKYSMAILNCCAIFDKFGSSGKNYWEAFNFSVLGDCSNKQASFKKTTHTGVQPGIFRGKRGFLDWWHFDKCFMCDTQKKNPAEKNFGVFSPRCS